MQPSVIEEFTKTFPGIIDLESESYARVPSNIEHQNIHIESGSENDIEILVTLIRDQVLKELNTSHDEDGDPDLPPNSVIVFCENRNKMNRICEELAKLNVVNLPFNDNTK